uniref:Uncharacterized protein n=1 Tax=Arundo donax TaxID=35708 RepID=A0A0A9CE15_ARUDO
MTQLHKGIRQMARSFCG